MAVPPSFVQKLGTFMDARHGFAGCPGRAIMTGDGSEILIDATAENGDFENEPLAIMAGVFVA